MEFPSGRRRVKFQLSRPFAGIRIGSAEGLRRKHNVRSYIRFRSLMFDLVQDATARYLHLRDVQRTFE
jgi:hypothetical protein